MAFGSLLHFPRARARFRTKDAPALWIPAARQSDSLTNCQLLRNVAQRKLQPARIKRGTFEAPVRHRRLLAEVNGLGIESSDGVVTPGEMEAYARQWVALHALVLRYAATGPPLPRGQHTLDQVPRAPPTLVQHGAYKCAEYPVD